jgi:ribosome-associated protein
MPKDDETAPATQPDGGGWAGPSRSQKKRDARAVTELGERLVNLSPAALDRLPIDDELRAALDVGQRVQRAARARQLRRIGKLLRDRDHHAISVALNEVGQPSGRSIIADREAKRWLERLATTGDGELDVLLAEHRDADRQQLRQLVRRARRQPPDAGSERARRTLLRALRELFEDDSAPAIDDG